MSTSFKNLKETLTLRSLVIDFLNILTNLRHITLQPARRLNAKFFKKRNFAYKMAIFLHFKHLFHGQSYFSVIVIYIQLSKHSQYKHPQKKKIGSINLIHTWFQHETYSNILQYFSYKRHISKIKHSSPDSIHDVLMN